MAIPFSSRRARGQRNQVRLAGVRTAVVASFLVINSYQASIAGSPRFGAPAWFSSVESQGNSVNSSGQAAKTTTGGAVGTSTGTSASIFQSVANFAQAARAVAQAQAAQAAARSAPGTGSSVSTPDGLTPGGLWVNQAAVAAKPSLWSGAALPTATASGGAPGAVGHAGGTIVTVNQTSQFADLTWTSFNIGANTTLQFNQGGSNWSVLNRVADPSLSPTQILGAIKAPGEVLITNQNGIVFAPGSQVNVGALVASTAILASDQFAGILSAQNSAGAYVPTFQGASAPITVQAGALITSNPPGNSTQSGGFVLLAGQTVTNNGQITTTNGQTVLAAGRDFTIRAGYSADNNPTSTTLGLEVAASGVGVATNNGLITATTGDITLTGQTVLQAGVLLSSTTVTQRGTIHLLTNTNDTTASITFAPNSLTAIQPEDDGQTATDAARAALIAQSATNNALRGSGTPPIAPLSNQLSSRNALPDQQYESRIEVVSGGTVEFQQGALGLSTGGQIAVYAAGRVMTDSGATLSVAGSLSTVLPASANTLQIQLQGYDLRDAPANRDTGVLVNQKVNVAVDTLVGITESGSSLLYTPGGLLEVSGYVAGVGHTIGEWTSVGGSIMFSSAEVVAQPGTILNIAGGQVSYAAGYTANTWLEAANGHLYNINTAPMNIAYTGVYDGFIVNQPRWGVTQTFISPLIAPAETYSPAYTVGRDAGTLTINAPTTIMEAEIAAGVVTGAYQNAARPTSVSDPFTLAQTVVPLSGGVIFGPPVFGGEVPTIVDTDVMITQSGQPIAGSLGLTTPLPPDRIGTTWLAASELNDAGLGGLTFVTQGAIAIRAPVSMADGGSILLVAPTINLSGQLTARGGAVTAGNNASTYSGAILASFLEATSANGSVVPASFTMGPDAAIDTRGVFTNAAVDPGTRASAAFVNGGAVSIDSSGSVSLAAGSLIDASAGGAVSVKLAEKGGSGGAVSITAYDPLDLDAPAASGQVTFGATLRAFGSGSVPCTSCVGGALTLTVPNVVIGGVASTDPSTVSLTPAFFASGFSSYTIVGQNSVTVANGTQVAVVQPIRQFTSSTLLAQSGADPAVAFSTGLPALYTPNPATATLTQRVGASIKLVAGDLALTPGRQLFPNAAITIGVGATIAVDPSQPTVGPTQTIALQAPGQITINGSLIAPSGTISVVNGQYEGTASGTPANLSIWLGPTSVLDVSAQAVTATDVNGRTYGIVPSGGTIDIGGQTITSADGAIVSTIAFIAVSPGAVLTAAGTSAFLNPAAGPSLTGGALGLSPTGASKPVSSNGGTISFDSESGIFLGGSTSAPSGGAGAQGGTLSVNLVTPDYTDTTRFAGPPPEVAAYQSPRELVVGAGMQTIPAATQAGGVFPDSAFGSARVSTSQVSGGGFDTVRLTSGDAIVFDGSVTLQAGKLIALSAAVIADSSTAGTVMVTAPYVTLTGGNSPLQAGITFSRVKSPAFWQPSGQPAQAVITVSASDIDIAGNVFGGINSAVVPAGVSGPVGCPANVCPVVDLPGFASITLSSAGDIRFLPTAASAATAFTTPGNLTFIAGQIYPVSGAKATLTAGFAYDAVSPLSSYQDTLSFTESDRLTIQTALGPQPAVPLTAGGSIALEAGVIDQGGVLRAPDGEISLGYLNYLFASGQTSPNLNQKAATSEVILRPGSVTSVSMDGLTIPYGGTSDGTSYTLASSSAPVTLDNPVLPTPRLLLAGEAVNVQNGALIDVSGGGVLAGAGFVPGRGGSINILQTPMLALTSSGTVTAPSASANLVFAIIPGFTGSVAPPPATATTFEGPLPALGEQISIGAGVPGLPAGTYTLLPGSDALLPGAFRVQLATAVHTMVPGGTPLGNGSYTVAGYESVANTALRNSLPVVVTVTPAATVRNDAQYNETSYEDFLTKQAALFGFSRSFLTLPADAKTLMVGLASAGPGTAALALQLQGTVSSAPGSGGLGGIVEIQSSAPIEVVGNGGAPTSGMVSVRASDLSSLHADTLVIGAALGTAASQSEIYFQASSAAPAVFIRDDATLSASQIFLASNAQISIADRAAISTVGNGMPSLTSDGGVVFFDQGVTVLTVSNGAVSFLPATSSGSITIGAASLLAKGTIATVTTGAVMLDPMALLGAGELNLSASTINLGTPPPGSAVAGVMLTTATLQSLLAGGAAVGVPPLRNLTLTATDSIGFYGSLNLNTIDPATGGSTLQLFQINSPTLYGAPGATVHLTTGTFIWNGAPASSVSQFQLPGGSGGGSGTPTTLSIATTGSITFGYGPADQAQDQTTLNRLIVGFDSVTFAAGGSMGGNNKGLLTVSQGQPSYDSSGNPVPVGGDLTLITPLLTGGPGSVFAINAGGSLTILAPAAGVASTAAMGQGAALTLTAASISNATTIGLPSGALVANAQGPIVLADGSVLNLAGIVTTLSGNSTYGWGGDITLRSASAGITETSGASINVSANQANAGTVTLSAPGIVSLGGAINGAAAAGFTSGSFGVRAGGLGTSDPTIGFVTLNNSLQAGGFFASRSFELLNGSLTIPTGTTVTASSVTVSVDKGDLTVGGAVNASGATPGAVRLSAGGSLTVAPGAVIDAHGTAPQTDSLGNTIDSENTASVVLTAVSGTLSVGAATIDVSAASGVTCAIGACGQVTLNAPRTGETSGDISISVPPGVSIKGAGSIAVNAFWTYQDAAMVSQAPGPSVTIGYAAGAPVQSTDPFIAASAFMAAAVPVTSNSVGVLNAALQAKLTGLPVSGASFHLRPGVEIDSPTDLTVATDLDLSTYRYQSIGVAGQYEPGVLVLRAAGNLYVNGSINDGFTNAPVLYSDVAGANRDTPGVLRTYWELAQPMQTASGDPNPVALSWSIRLVAGADLQAADSRIVVPTTQPTATQTTASIILSDPHTQPYNAAVTDASTFQLPGWSVIRTGTGDLELLAGGSITELSTYAIYTAGASVESAGGSAFNLPRGTTTPVPELQNPANMPPTALFTQSLPGRTSTINGTYEFEDPFGNIFKLACSGEPTCQVTVKSVRVGGVYVSEMFDQDGNRLASVPLKLASAASGADVTVATGTPLKIVGAAGIRGFQATIDEPALVGGVYAVLGTNGQAANNGIVLESLVNGSNYAAWYPAGGGNLLISAGGDITGYLPTPTQSSTSAYNVQPMDDVGAWLWRQGGGGASTAWWINFGTLALPLTQTGSDTPGINNYLPVPTLTGFAGIGTLGGGNVTITAGGNVGAISAITSPNASYSLTQAIDVAIGSTGRVTANGTAETGGGALTIRAGGALNGGGTAVDNSQANGTITNTRGSINLTVGSVGEIVLTYPTGGGSGGEDPRALSALTAYAATPQGGPILVPGDAIVTLQSRGDLVLGGVGDATRLVVQNLMPADLNQGGAASGLSWFTLWQPGTTISLVSVGGNLAVNDQSQAVAANAIATDYRYVYPPILNAVASSGSIYGGVVSGTSPVSSIELAPSPIGNLVMFAAQSIYGDSQAQNPLPQSFDISGASTSVMPTPSRPALITVADFNGTVGSSNLATGIGAQALSLFTYGADTATGSLHAGDSAPAEITAGGDIVAFHYGETLCFSCTANLLNISPTTWYISGKAVQIIAGGDIVDLGTPLGQTNPPSSVNYTSTSGLILNNNATDVSVVQAGGEILYVNATVAGPGQLYVQAGGNVYQADQGVLQTLGPVANGMLSANPSRAGGAGITVLAGAGSSGPDWNRFAQTYLAPAAGYTSTLLSFLQANYGYAGSAGDAPAFFEALPIAQQRAFLLQIYFGELNDSGLEFTDPTSDHYKSYIRGQTAVASLFPAGSTGTGDITLFPTTLTSTIGNSGIRTDFGGGIALLTPGGQIVLGNTTPPPPPCPGEAACPNAVTTNPAGVLTQGSGDIDFYSYGSIVLGQSRVFTTFGGNILMWSADGDINAGRGSKTTQLVSTIVITYDAAGQVTLTPGIPTSGAGIATLAPLPDTPAGDVNLVAPKGVIDAGEAGIRVAGSANLAALSVLNAANVQVGGKASGLPTVAAPNVSALSAASATAAAATQAAQQAAATSAQASQPVVSTITVDVLGFGDT